MRKPTTANPLDTMPYDDRDGVIWVNGEFVEWCEAKTHILCHGLHYGSGVFEGERCYNGKIFKAQEHHERLIKSAEIIGMKPIGYTPEQLTEIAYEVLKRNNITEGYVRPVAWRGSEMMAISASQTSTNLAIAAWFWPSYFSPEIAEKGIKIKTASWKKPAPDCTPFNAKCNGQYVINTMNKHEAEDAGYHDSLVLDWRGYISEGTGANIFLIMEDGKIHTPTPDCFLDGITRQTVIGIAKREGYELVERHIKPEELLKTKELFFTGTAAEVTPIGQVDEQIFPVGPVTKALMAAYAAEVGKE